MDKINHKGLTLNKLTVEDIRVYSTLELIYRVIDYMNQVIDMNHSFSQDLSELRGILSTIMDEGLESAVIEVLESWVADGRLQNIVNQALTRINDIGISVKHFGAVGDGSTDDTQAIEDGLEFLGRVGGGTLIFPRGDYLWGKMLLVHSNTTIKCLGGSRLVRNHDGSFLVNGLADENYEAYGANSHITIDGGLWDGNVNRQTSGYNMLNFGKGEHIKIMNATFKDYSGGHVLDISGCRHVVVDKCKFIGFRPTTNREFAEAVQISEHTALGLPEVGGHDHTPCYDVTVSNCYFGTSGTGATYGANGIGTHSATHNIYNYDIKIKDNVFENAYYVGVRLFKYKDCIVKGNVFRSCARGVTMSNVVGNSLSSQDKDGVQSYMCQSGQDFIITENIFDGCTTNAIYGSGQAYRDDTDNSLNNYDKIKHVVISNNIIRNGKGTNDVLLIMAHDVHMVNNQFSNGKRAIASIMNDNLRIENNNFHDFTTESIYIHESDTYFPWLKGTGLSADIHINNNIVKNMKQTGIFINAPMIGGSVKGNHVENACSNSVESNNRNGITISAGAKDMVVCDNVIKPSEGYMGYGLLVTNTCDNILAHDNIASGGSLGDVYVSSIRALNHLDHLAYNDRSLSSLTYCALGDSITASGDYQITINRMCGFKETTTVAQSGIESIQLAKAIDDGTITLPSADVYTILIGVNDFRHSVPLGLVTDSPQEALTTFAQGLRRLIQQCYVKSSDDFGRIIIVTPYKNNDTPNFNTTNDNGHKLIDYVNLAKEIASYYSLPVVDLYNESGINTFTFDDFLSDNLHPSWKGHKRIGMMIAKEIQRTL